MRRILYALALVLGGCAGMEDASLPAVSVEPVGGGGFPGATGEASLTVRSLAADAQGITREVAGTNCTLRSTLYTQQFTTPARLLVPSYGRQSPELRIDCAGVAGQGSAQVRPFFRRANGFGGWPAIGVSAGSGGDVGVSVGGWWNGGWGWNNPDALVVEYPAVQVMLR